MNEILIRTASPEDLEALLQFEQGVIEAERPFDTTLKADPVYYYDLPVMLSSPDTELAVAEINGRIIASGYARIEKAEPYQAYKEYAYLGFMYADQAFRGKGINQLIMAYLEKWAASKRIGELRLEVYEQNSNAIRAYEKAGFSKLMILMRKEIIN